jgi:branched-chain amino acid transport system ATP-binding protein
MPLPEAKTRMLLQVERLEVVYHHVAIAVQDVTLSVPERAIIALLGTNGAGKTTTLRAISGFLGLDNAAITEGQVTFLGRVVNGQTPHARAREGLVLIPERTKVFETLTVQENLAALVRGSRPGPGLDVVFDLFPVLAQRRSQLAGYLSGGERQMLAIATALLCRPVVLLIDELSPGLAPRVVDELMQLVRRLRDELGLAVLLVEQNVGAALEIADYGYVMENGRVVYDASPERLLAHQDIQEFYLGVGTDTGQRRYSDVKQYRRRRRWF